MYKKLTKKNYKSYEADFISLKDIRLNIFIQEIVSSGDVSYSELDFSPSSLTTVWRYVYPKIEMVSPVPNYPEDQIPIWFYLHEDAIHTHDRGYTLKTLWLIDGLVYYFGEVFIQNNEELKWEAFYEPNSRIDYQYKPVIKGLTKNYIYPFYQVFTSAVRTWIDDEDVSSELSETNLFDLYENLINLEKYAS